MTVITMSRTELSRLRVMIDLPDGRTRVEDAAALIGLQRRQVYQLLDAFRAHGPDALISKRRGKPSNRAHGAAFRQTCLAIVRERYEDFGPTLAAEKLAEVHGLPIGIETLRQWMIDDGIWVRRRDRMALASPHPVAPPIWSRPTPNNWPGNAAVNSPLQLRRNSRTASISMATRSPTGWWTRAAIPVLRGPRPSWTPVRR